MMGEQGYLDASAMAKTFDALRANDLIWNYVVERLADGRGAAGVRPAGVERRLAPGCRPGCTASTCAPATSRTGSRRGAMRMLGRRIELGKVTADTYYVAAEQDHITPWMSCYDSSQLLGGDVRFVLSSSGHIAGIVNPPGGRRIFRTNDARPAAAEKWLETATSHDGSWWDDWATWMRERGGRRGKPPGIGNDEHPALCDAPGTYVLAR